MPNRILIAEDEEELSTYLKKRLTEEGYEVVVASNGREAVTKTSQYMPDLILMDIEMPLMDGPEAIKNIKNDPETKNIPVIFVTGMLSNEDSEEVQEGFSVDGQHYDTVVKPFEFQILLEKIQEIFKEDHL